MTEPEEGRSLPAFEAQVTGQVLVAIGASAGGLDPLEAFFRSAPVDAGWSFAVIQHLSPDYRSVMDEILARRTSLAIRHIEDGLELAPDTIFLNPPNTLVEVIDNTFRLTPYRHADSGPHHPIDAFFRSMARRAAGRSVAVVLSGTGSDGAQGARDLQNSGGSVIVQAPREAKFDAMPLAVLATGSVDRVLGAAEMPAAIAEMLTGNDSSRREDLERQPQSPGEAIVQLLERVHHIDFSAYKSPTVSRRIERRQQLRGIESLDEYHELLRKDSAALEELFHDLLIGVTEFYRDPEAYSVLSQQALTRIVSAASGVREIRVWVPGCASGEEAYSIAIELSEILRQRNIENQAVRVIATDVHRASIRHAANGVYKPELLAKLPQELRDRYFVEHRNGLAVDPAIRQQVIFSVHNALSDPPFMRLDLISCRNLLIYLDDEAQNRLISMFLFGLQKDGYLLLGGSESIGRFESEFHTVSSKWRLFRKSTDRRIVDQSLLAKRMGKPIADQYARSFTRDMPRRPLATVDESDGTRDREMLIGSYDALLKRFAPSSILINENGEVQTWFGAASDYVDTMSDLADWTVEDILHEDLQYPINVGIERIRRNPTETFSRTASINLGDSDVRRVALRIEALANNKKGGRSLLVTLEALGDGGNGASDSASTQADEVDEQEDRSLLVRRIRELEKDLLLTEESLQYVTERLEASGEELQASNEELQASNEELQASNEEMQSSNEELQAVNEELVTVSAEHERKIELLSTLNHDMELIFGMLEIGVIMLDNDLKLVRFTDVIGPIFALEAHDVGRAIANVGARPEFVDLAELARTAANSGDAQEASGEMDGQSLHVRAVPYSKASGAKGEGVVIVISRRGSAQVSSKDLPH